MSDKYSNFSELAAAEPSSAYAITVVDAGSPVAIAAPHAGGIEPGTSEICVAVACSDLSYYLFEGLKPQGNRNLHITSSNFDEPQCLQLLKASDVVVTIHGERRNDDVVYLGGLHRSATESIRAVLTSRGFDVKEHASPVLQGRAKENICNIGRLGAGVQLELSRGLRGTFFASMSPDGRRQPTPRLQEFCHGVREGLLRNGL